MSAAHSPDKRQQNFPHKNPKLSSHPTHPHEQDSSKNTHYKLILLMNPKTIR